MTFESILQIGSFPDDLQGMIDAQFRACSEVEVLADDGLRQQIRAIITRSNCTIEAAQLGALPNLKVVATSGVGFDGIPLDAARARQVVVTNTPDVLNDAVCELALGLLLALLRQIPAADRYVRDGSWQQAPFGMGTGLAGKRVGIVGLGRIGKGIARRLESFGVTLAYTGSKPQPQVAYAFFPDALALAGFADILIVSCRGGDATRHLINADVLRQLGPDGFLVNVARGSVVDEPALIGALESGAIRGAALDVFDTEPLADSPLRALPNTVLTPHVASATTETRRAMMRLALDNIARVLAGEAPLTPV